MGQKQKKIRQKRATGLGRRANIEKWDQTDSPDIPGSEGWWGCGWGGGGGDNTGRSANSRRSTNSKLFGQQRAVKRTQQTADTYIYI